ncbi:MAG: DUF1285 domain-containing protein [Methyloceanibacter sp.]|uniref:DUF1285 domain-containing protein n=1 Tax=Methyloceanibacter sp. TaxID=1965321 RepID=UPI003D9AFE6E
MNDCSGQVMPDQEKADILVALEEVRGKPRPGTLRNINDCGDIGLKIGHDGTWFYRDSAIGRKPLVKLFASVLRREDDGRHYLVTPVEKVLIEVADAPFMAIEMWSEGGGEAQRLFFRTNVDDVVSAGPEHPLHFRAGEEGAPVPYVLVRDGLEAKLARPIYYELVALAVPGGARKETLGVWSGGMFYPFPTDDFAAAP